MDGLALLCNLFADGPLTLRRLRAAGVRRLAELEHVEPARLSEWLHASPAQAREFTEEARRLSRRIGDEPPPQAGFVGARAHEPSAIALPEPSLAPPGEPIRELPRPIVLAPVAREIARESQAPPTPALAMPDPPGTPLRTGLLPGLDAPAVASLAQFNVRTIQALAESAGLSLSRRTGIPYSSLLALAREARRFALEHAAPAPPPAPIERVVVSATPDARTDEFTLPPEDPGSSGPFG